MTAPRLSPAMCNALHTLCHGGPCMPRPTTQRALQQRGLVDSQGQPTAAGRAVFAQRGPAAITAHHTTTRTTEASPC